jgi:hypothetical protein
VITNIDLTSRMYYDSKSVDTLLTCQYCLKRFDTPRLLIPCGNTICTRCLAMKFECSDLNSDTADELYCSVCNEKHPKLSSIQDYPVQKQMHSLLKLEAKTVSRGLLYENTYSLINRLESKLSDLKENTSNKTRKISDYCEYLRDEIDVNCESAIEEIRKSREAMFDKIKAYEKQCLEVLACSGLATDCNEANEELIGFLNENLVFVKAIKSQLETNTNIDDRVLDGLYKKSKDIFKNLSLFENKLNYTIFNGRFYFINEASACFSNEIERILDKRCLNILLDVNRLDRLNSFNLKYCFKSDLHIEDSSYLIHHIEIAPLDESDLVLVVQYYNSMTNLFGTHLLVYKLVTSNRQTTGFDFNLKKVLFSDNVKFELLATHENLVVCLFSNSNSTYRLSVFDGGCLDLVKQINILDYVPKSMSISSKQIYLLSNIEPLVHCYDLDLNEVNRFGQCTNPNELFYMSNAWYLFVNQKKLFFTNHYNTSINVLSEVDGKLLKKIDINFDNSNILVDTLSRFLIFNRLKKKLSVLTVDFDLDLNSNDIVLFEKDFTAHFNYDTVHNFYTFGISNNGHLVICDLDNLCLYVY